MALSKAKKEAATKFWTWYFKRYMKIDVKVEVEPYGDSADIELTGNEKVTKWDL